MIAAVEAGPLNSEAVDLDPEALLFAVVFLPVRRADGAGRVVLAVPMIAQPDPAIVAKLAGGFHTGSLALPAWISRQSLSGMPGGFSAALASSGSSSKRR